MSTLFGRRSLAPLLALLALPVQAALPPCATEGLMAEADTVVQLQENIVLGTDDPMICEVMGTVAHVFSGYASTGQIITARFPCDMPAGMVGAMQVTDISALTAAPFVELHLTNGEAAAYGAGVVLAQNGDRLGEMVYRPAPMCG